MGVRLVTGILSVSVTTVHSFDPVMSLLELYSSEMLASEHVFIPELFERGKMKIKHRWNNE